MCVVLPNTECRNIAQAIFLAAMPLAGNPAFRQVYDATLDTFPAAEILLAGSIYFISAILNLVIYHQRWRKAEKRKKTMLKMRICLLQDTVFLTYDDENVLHFK